MADCPSCNVKPGEQHDSGCDVERCQTCGGQAIACDCEYGPRPVPWDGEWPGVKECREYGFWSVWDDERGWRRCEAGAPGATEDLNHLRIACVWDAVAQRWQKR